jgi:hypothetical protein
MERVARLERKVDFLFQSLGLDPEAALVQNNSLPSSFYDALGNGNMITAIKIYREAMGVDLKDAKNAVEAMRRDRR